MTNSDAGSELGDEIMHSIADEYGGLIIVLLSVSPSGSIPGFWFNPSELFEARKGFDLAVTLENGQLIIQATGEGKVPLYAETEAKFFATVIPAGIEFVKDGQGEVTDLVLHRNGHDMKASKK